MIAHPGSGEGAHRNGACPYPVPAIFLQLSPERLGRAPPQIRPKTFAVLAVAEFCADEEEGEGERESEEGRG